MINSLGRYIVKKLIERSKRRQEKTSLCDLSLWGLEINEKEHLCVQGIDAVDMISEFGSPLLVVNRKLLLEEVQKTQKAMEYAPEGSKILYSYKTNCIPGILKELHELRIGAEVISEYELWLALRLNVKGEMIIYNGVDKSDESIRAAIDNNVLAINIDQREEVDRIYSIAREMGKKARVGVRLGFLSGAQFGLDVDNGEALNVAQKIKKLSDYLELHCVHFNVTSNSKNAETHKYYALKALRFIKELKSIENLKIQYLDIGGGFGVPTTKNLPGREYGLYRAFGYPPIPPLPGNCQPIAGVIKEIIQCISDNSADLNIPLPEIIIEPGRLITSRSEILLARVLAAKKRDDGTNYCITDAGRLSITFPCDFEYHEVFIANRMKAPKKFLYQITGRVCTSADWMFKNRYMPEVSRGDILAVMDAGAYFSSYSTNFAFPRPAIIMVKYGEIKMIRREEAFNHLVAMDTNA